jgi:hypothetical protein
MVIRIPYVSYYELLLLKGHLVPLNQREGAFRAKSQLSRLLLKVEDHILNSWAEYGSTSYDQHETYFEI